MSGAIEPRTERRGDVIGLADGLATIRLERAPACSGCGSRGTCASGNAAEQIIQMPVPERTRLGDQLTVSLPSASLTLAALLGYLLPPVSLLLGAISAATCFEGDAAAVLGAGVGLAAGLLLVRLISGRVLGERLTPSFCSTQAPLDFQTGEHP